MPRRAIVWYRRDLRVADHPALLDALDAADEVVPVFILDDRLLFGRTSGANRRAFLHGALGALDADLRERGGRLFFGRGRPLRVLRDALRETGASSVWCTRDLTPYARRRDERVGRALDHLGIEFHQRPGNYLTDPDRIATEAGSPFRAFTPFSKAARAAGWRGPLDAPDAVRTPRQVTGLGTLPPERDFRTDGAATTFAPDPARALARLRWFGRTRADRYGGDRDLPAEDATSKISPYLRLGLVSPHQAAAVVDRGGHATGGRRAYVDELLWRDFYAYVLYHFPYSAWEDLRPEFTGLEWERDPDGLRAWKEGRTGYPIVDAGMRQLAAEGWMHNRARMVTASFLTKDLLIHWREGALHFMRLLVDGDLASNNGGWQWAASTGTDAQPYFRVLNPVTQGRRFDPSGAYVRRWVPELARVDQAKVHAPWTMTPAEQEAAGVVIGRDYPTPIVDHARARRRALARFEAARTAQCHVP
jgi:deoxyribodipyrimidine photo-lyase